MKRLQIGVMGSAADLNYSKEFEKVAEKLENTYIDTKKRRNGYWTHNALYDKMLLQ